MIDLDLDDEADPDLALAAHDDDDGVAADDLAKAVWMFNYARAEVDNWSQLCERIAAYGPSIWRDDSDAAAALRLRAMWRRRARDCHRWLDEAFAAWLPAGEGH